MSDVLDMLWSNALLLLMGAVLLWIGSAVIGRMRREATAKIVDRGEADPLSPFADAYRRGQMSDEEYQRIRQTLASGAGLAADPPRPISSRDHAVSPAPEAPPEPPPSTAGGEASS